MLESMQTIDRITTNCVEMVMMMMAYIHHSRFTASRGLFFRKKFYSTFKKNSHVAFLHITFDFLYGKINMHGLDD